MSVIQDLSMELGRTWRREDELERLERELVAAGNEQKHLIERQQSEVNSKRHAMVAAISHLRPQTEDDELILAVLAEDCIANVVDADVGLAKRMLRNIISRRAEHCGRSLEDLGLYAYIDPFAGERSVAALASEAASLWAEAEAAGPGPTEDERVRKAVELEEAASRLPIASAADAQAALARLETLLDSFRAEHPEDPLYAQMIRLAASLGEWLSH